jgi:uncharacterized protein (DUF1501 family)
MHLARLLQTNADMRRTIRMRLGSENPYTAWFTRDGYCDPLNAQVAMLLWLIDSHVHCPLYKLSLGGFDLHANLRGEHERLLGKMETALLGLRRGLQQIGVWNDTLIVVHSEFGRRPAENASAGCDHGTCGPVLLLGGGVQGGVHGPRSSLEKLDASGNPAYGTDFRAIYRAIAERFWKIPADPQLFGNLPALDIRL